MNEDKEVVKIELIFEDGKEEIELSKNEFLVIQTEALKDNMTFEDKFMEILRRYIEVEENGNDSM